MNEQKKISILLECLSDLCGGQTELSNFIGVSRSVVNSWIRRNSIPSKYFNILAQAICVDKITIYELFDIVKYSSIDIDENKLRKIIRQYIKVNQNSHSFELIQYVNVPVITRSPISWDDDITQFCGSTFPVMTDILNQIKSNNLLIYQCETIHMEPTIPYGSMVIVDRDDREVIDKDLYVVCIERDLLIYELKHDNSKIVCTPHNKTCPQIELGEHDFILGKAVYIINAIPLPSSRQIERANSGT